MKPKLSVIIVASEGQVSVAKVVQHLPPKPWRT